jgi:hypothetical protein
MPPSAREGRVLAHRASKKETAPKVEGRPREPAVRRAVPDSPVDGSLKLRSGLHLSLLCLLHFDLLRIGGLLWNTHS